MTENGYTKRIVETITRYPDGSYDKNIEEIVDDGKGIPSMTGYTEHHDA